MTQTEENTIVRSRQPLTVAELRHHLIQIESGYGENKKKSDYLPMQGRILWFHGEVSRYKIETELVSLDFNAVFTKEKWTKENGKATKITVSDTGVAVFKATVTIYHEETGAIQIQTPGHKMETKIDFPDYLEKAETGAIGRALALAGYGTKFAIELREDDRLVDSPVVPNGSTTKTADGAKNQIGPVLSDVQALCEEVYGAGKWRTVVMKVLGAEAVGDVPDELLGAAQLKKIETALIQVKQKRQAGGGR